MKFYPFFPVLISVVISACSHSKNEDQTVLPKPSGNCTYARDEKNALGKHIRVVEDEKFISLSFADSASRALYKGEDFFKGYLSCVSVDSVMGLYFSFKIHTEDAFHYYGMIKKGNKITFILKSGKAIELPFGTTFSGNTNLSKEISEYATFAYLPREAASQLQTEELGNVKISWSKRDEEYTVVNPRIFINQIPCVK
ncbi:MAG TPA: hypothetical protein VII99_09970 [Bacteroidia bacterium]